MAFRTRARQLHPDVSTQDDAAARFQELSTAYQVLHDPQERARYDRGTQRAERGGSPARPRRPTFSTRRPARDVPRFLDADAPGRDPVVIRLEAVFRWFR
jgi:DnaJ-class molecular chaperone